MKLSIYYQMLTLSQNGNDAEVEIWLGVKEERF